MIRTGWTGEPLSSTVRAGAVLASLPLRMAAAALTRRLARQDQAVRNASHALAELKAPSPAVEELAARAERRRAG